MTDEQVDKMIAATLKGPAAHFPWEALTALVAVLVTAVTVVQSWAIIGKRLDDLEKSRDAHAAALGIVPELKWSVNTLQGNYVELRHDLNENTKALNTLNMALDRMGIGTGTKSGAK